MGMLSKSIGQWLEQNEIYGAEKLKTVVTVNFRDFPTTIEELKLRNYSGATLFEMSIEKELSQAIIECRSNFWVVFSQRCAHIQECISKLIH